MFDSAAGVLRRAFTLTGVVVAVTACGDSFTDPERSLQPDVSQDAGALNEPPSAALVGKRIFEDANLSLNRNQSCASCHDAAWGFTGPIPAINAAGAVMPGSVASRFGTRKPPSAAYATQSPVLFFDDEDGTYVGGNFWDGHATGARLGSPAAEQALNPFVGGVEQALTDRACVIARILHGRYANLYQAVWGGAIATINFPAGTAHLCQMEGVTVSLSPADRALVDAEYDNVGRSIAAFEASPVVNQFSSKYDAFLDGVVALSERELRGLALYEGKANCAACHPNEGKQALFTDFTYDNIGIPSNPLNPNFGLNPSFTDVGLGGFVSSTDEDGKFKVPTLRNLDKRGIPFGAKSYMHNGALKSIAEVVHFYNTRDVLPDCATIGAPVRGRNCWPAPEVLPNVNHDELGDLGLTVEEEAAVVAYLKTLTDGYYHPVLAPTRR